MPLTLITARAVQPVTLAEAKLAARISDTTAFDALVPGLIATARQLTPPNLSPFVAAQNTAWSQLIPFTATKPNDQL